MINQEAMNKSAVQSSNCIDHESKGLYDPHFEHDNCGIGAIVNIKGNKTHDTVSGALEIVEKLEHRAGFLRKRQSPSGLRLAGNVIMVWVCSSCHRMS